MQWEDLQRSVFKLLEPALTFVWKYPDLATIFAAVFMLVCGGLLFFLWRREKNKPQEMPQSSLGKWGKKNSKTSSGREKAARPVEEVPFPDEMILPATIPSSSGPIRKPAGPFKKASDDLKMKKPQVVVTEQSRREMDDLITKHTDELAAKWVAPEVPVDHEGLKESGVLQGLAEMMVSPVTTEEEKGVRYSKMSIEGSLIFDETEDEGSKKS